MSLAVLCAFPLDYVYMTTSVGLAHTVLHKSIPLQLNVWSRQVSVYYRFLFQFPLLYFAVSVQKSLCDAKIPLAATPLQYVPGNDSRAC